ncbi:hypothetical protein C8R45DRAFT_1166031 [Mycena sanguinolenta]|nr:hypothetical protein C8R45DRAFT_1166031 [Mycena sanguinolenta]
MFNPNAILVWMLGTVVSSALATPIEPDDYRNATLEVCSGSVTPPTGCVTIPLVSDSCIDLMGGFSGLDKEISSAVVPDCFSCRFFQDFGCSTSGVPNAGTESEIVLPYGIWNFSSVPGPSGTTNFDNLTSSFTCSAVDH